MVNRAIIWDTHYQINLCKFKHISELWLLLHTASGVLLPVIFYWLGLIIALMYEIISKFFVVLIQIRVTREGIVSLRSIIPPFPMVSGYFPPRVNIYPTTDVLKHLGSEDHCQWLWKILGVNCWRLGSKSNPPSRGSLGNVQIDKTAKRLL